MKHCHFHDFHRDGVLTFGSVYHHHFYRIRSAISAHSQVSVTDPVLVPHPQRPSSNAPPPAITTPHALDHSPHPDALYGSEQPRPEPAVGVASASHPVPRLHERHLISHALQLMGACQTRETCAMEGVWVGKGEGKPSGTARTLCDRATSCGQHRKGTPCTNSVSAVRLPPPVPQNHARYHLKYYLKAVPNPTPTETCHHCACPPFGWSVGRAALLTTRIRNASLTAPLPRSPQALRPHCCCDCTFPCAPSHQGLNARRPIPTPHAHGTSAALRHRGEQNDHTPAPSTTMRRSLEGL